MDNQEYCVYKHVSPEGKIYIGQTKQAPLTRWQTGDRYRGNTELHVDILRFGGESAFIDAFEHYTLTRDNTWEKWNRGTAVAHSNIFASEESDILEKWWISYYSENEITPLYNKTSGGRSGFTMAPETVAKIAAIFHVKYQGDGNPFAGKHHTEETKEKLRQAREGQYNGEDNPFYGKHHTMQTRKAQSAAKIGMYDGEKNPFAGKHHTEQTKQAISKRNSKSVRQYTLRGEFVREFPSLSAAAQSVGLTIAAVSYAAAKHGHIAGGFQWRCEGDETPVLPLEGEDTKTVVRKTLARARSKPILQYDIEGNWVAEYPSLQAAAAAVGISATKISAATRIPNRKAAGFYWKYKEQ